MARWSCDLVSAFCDCCNGGRYDLLSLFLQQSRCRGILSWKHFARHTKQDFYTWQVTYNKKRRTTSLRVSYSGMMGLRSYAGSAWYCTNIDILFNNKACSRPAPIRSGWNFWQRDHNSHRNFISPSIVTGYCNGLSSGSVTITVIAKKDPSSEANGHYTYNGAGPYRPSTYSLIVEELCPN